MTLKGVSQKAHGTTALNMPSYPSNCLEFAKSFLATEPRLSNCKDKARVSLNIILVGAGLGGLSTAIALTQSGHKVTVYEQTPILGEVGAGIQVPSNSTRALFKLGLESYLKPYVTEPESISFRRWQTGKIIGNTKLVPDFVENFGAPYYVIHRAHFHSALCQKAHDMGIEIKLGAKVEHYDPVAGSITLTDGTTYTGDLVIAADGIKSVARKIVLGGEDMAFRKPGFAAYRATVDVQKMRNDPDISWILQRPALNIWIGDSRHVMTYTIGAGKAFNMVLSHPDTTDPSTWDPRKAVDNMKAEFQGWDPVLTKIIGMVENTLKWPLISGSILNKWVLGKVVILGDAAHAMLPYMSQGAAMAVEDGLALARVLSKIETEGQLGDSLAIFEKVRMQRAGQMQEASLLNSQLWHFADGPLQQARDAAMVPEVEGIPFSHSPNQWSDPATQMWCYGYDTERAIDEAWEENRTKNCRFHAGLRERFIIWGAWRSIHSQLTRFTLDPNAEDRRLPEPEVLHSGNSEFYRIDDRFSGSKYSHSYFVLMDPRLGTDFATIGPVMGGGYPPYNSLSHHDQSTGKTDVYFPGSTHLVQEPVFIPRVGSTEEGDGYLMALVNNYRTLSSELHLLDCLDFTKARAVILLPLRLRAGLHGNWVENN